MSLRLRPNRPGLAVAALGAVLALLALLPRVGRAASVDAAPDVDLTRLAVSESAVTAPAAVGGEPAELTVSARLQRAAKTLLASAKPLAGAVIAIHAPTGRVLIWAESTRDDAPAGSVLLAARAPAASVFKLVTTTALLEHGEVTPTLSVCTSGGNHRIERRHLDAPRGGRATCSPFALALGHSRNAVYAQLATHRLSRQDLLETAERFGFNRRLPFDAPLSTGELRLPYGDLEFARAAAGFRGSTLSPLGAAHLAYVVAAGGRAIRLRIVERSGQWSAPERRETVGHVMSPQTATALLRMMEVTAREGTSAEAFKDESGKSYLPGIRVAGKTGTLQPARGEPTTSWFTGFAPSRRPELVVSVMLVNGQVWRRKANEVARDVFRAYFHARGRRSVSDPLSAPAAGAPALARR